MVANTISYENAKQILLRLNISPLGISSFIGEQNKPVPIEHIELFQRYHKILLPSSDVRDDRLSFLWNELGKTHAAHQVYKYKNLKPTINNSRKVKFILMKSFIDSFEKLDNAFKQKKLKVYLYLLGDSPFNLNLKIYDINDKAININNKIATFNFDLYFTKNKEPGIILGNMQGNNKYNIDYFSKKHKEPFLNTIIKCFQEAFPGKEQTIALDTKFHHGYKNPHPSAVMYQLIRKNIGFEFNTDKEQEELINAKIIEIKTKGTGMHKAAYKKTGYKKPGSKTSGYHYLRRT